MARTSVIRHACSLSEAVPAVINGMNRNNQLCPTNTADKHASKIEKERKKEKQRTRNKRQITDVLCVSFVYVFHLFKFVALCRYRIFPVNKDIQIEPNTI